MKLLLIATCTLLLSACSATPVLQSSIHGNGYSIGPTSPGDPRLQHPQFYREESDSMPWLNAAPHNNQ